MVSIHAPAFGSSLPAEAPKTSSGAPMPSDSANSAAPPRTGSPVAPITISAAASGAATQGPTMSAENMPIAPAPIQVPDRWRLDSAASLVCSEAGTCSS